MIVPNYVPEPLEVPGNVSGQPYLVRLVFLRRVTLLYLASVTIVGMLTRVSFPLLGWPVTLAVLAGSLIALDLWRIVARGKPMEARVSSLLLPWVLVAVAWNLREISAAGWPIGQALAAPICMGIYTLLCGRDYSFVGNFVLSLIFSSVGVAAFASSAGLDGPHAAFALGTNALVLAYLVYDLASLLSRRRLGEEFAAVADLYRDVFNFPGYLWRCLRHWRQHRIWAR